MVAKETGLARERQKLCLIWFHWTQQASWAVSRAGQDYGRFIIYLVKLLLIPSHASMYIFFPL
jgi:hypothetical protein